MINTFFTRVVSAVETKRTGIKFMVNVEPARGDANIAKTISLEIRSNLRQIKVFQLL